MTARTGTATVACRDATGIWLIRLVGEHDVSTVPMLNQQTRAIWSGCVRTIVDVSEATFMDTTVANWFWRLRRKLEVAGLDPLTVVEARRGTVGHRLFALLGLRDAFLCFPALDDAIAHSSADFPGTRRPASDRGVLVALRTPRTIESRPAPVREHREVLHALLGVVNPGV